MHRKSPTLRLLVLMASVPGLAAAMAKVFPDALPSNRAAAGVYSLRNLALGEPRFANPLLYNLYDQGGSPAGLLENRLERLGLSAGLLGGNRATVGDSLDIGHRDYYIPQLSFLQGGMFGAILYFQRESASFRSRARDSVETGASLFGLDLAAGTASGRFRIGFGAHARLGAIEYGAGAKRVVLGSPSLRFDIGSRIHPAAEVGIYAGVGGHLDSLDRPDGRLDRNASMTLPRYGLLADIGGTEGLPALGNLVLELGTDRHIHEGREANGIGVVFPIIWSRYWSFQTQWMYPFQAGEARLAPAIRYAHRSEDIQGYEGIQGNQDPFEKGGKRAGLEVQRGVDAFGIGGDFSFREMISLLVEWETSGHGYESQVTEEERYNRFSLGLEHRVDRLPAAHLPEGLKLAMRSGWTWRQEGKAYPGYRDFHFAPVAPSPQIPARLDPVNAIPQPAAAYHAFHLGFGMGLWGERVGIEGLLSFPGQLEIFRARSEAASGTEFGLTLSYRVL